VLKSTSKFFIVTTVENILSRRTVKRKMLTNGRLTCSKPLKEEDEQANYFTYMKYKHPKILVNADMGGIKLSIGYAVKCKRLGNRKGWPDIFLAEPVGNYHGLFLEMKQVGVKCYKKDGSVVAVDRIIEQHNVLETLRSKGYVAMFCEGFDQAVTVTEDYLSGLLSNEYNTSGAYLETRKLHP